MLYRLSVFVGRNLINVGLLFFLTTISCTIGYAGQVVQHVVDFDGNGRTDYAVARLVGGPQIRWFYSLNPSGVTVAQDWGVELDESSHRVDDIDNNATFAIGSRALIAGSLS